MRLNCYQEKCIDQLASVYHLGYRPNQYKKNRWELTENPFNSGPMGGGGMVHELTNLINSKCKPVNSKCNSGLVQVRYWRAPTALRYSDGSERGSPSNKLSLHPLLCMAWHRPFWTYKTDQLHILFVKEINNQTTEIPQDPKNSAVGWDLSWQRLWLAAWLVVM